MTRARKRPGLEQDPGASNTANNPTATTAITYKSTSLVTQRLNGDSGFPARFVVGIDGRRYPRNGRLVAEHDRLIVALLVGDGELGRTQQRVANELGITRWAVRAALKRYREALR